MQTLPLSDVKARLSEIADEVDRTHERVHITRNGRDFVVLMAAEDLERLEETIAILSDPLTMRQLAESDAELARGEVVTAEEIAEDMRRKFGAA
ncbi:MULTISPECIES: type II toxin-antitoxin system Phd/YefM family antitoxin [unclassified Parafrankia]|uniref:type II toxin-antitoxin system Phd/YefM family antitoxin n=1 Tax=unclassified Parafrankia TaxID=2994368 RepID=UPI000DA50ACC|nr:MULTISPECIES: type II toxin-antitoxin system Phd/YefM family antitoxin [unclassified Parafrankia]TCJ34176.1 type II toxin-antitoxin system Phd/YefM family antitoxin [Parafrankia sp. BMG5.11]CAI7979743.1 Antitoxin RelB [Frankia sp. Hr75.2]SQD99459.1 Antitoxin RelB [Parafrankia sp. Ea1.12]